MYPEYTLSILESTKEFFDSKGIPVSILDSLYEKYGLKPNYENSLLDLNGESIILVADIDYEFSTEFTDAGYTTITADGDERSWKYDYNSFFPSYCIPHLFIYSTDHDSLVEMTRELCRFFVSEKRALVKHPLLPNTYIPISLCITNDNEDVQISNVSDSIYKSVLNFDLIDIPWSTGKIVGSDLESDAARRCWLKKLISSYEMGASMDLRLSTLKMQSEKYAAEIESLTEKRALLQNYYFDLMTISHVDSKLAKIPKFKEVLHYMETEKLGYLEATKKVLDDIESAINRKKQEREEKRELQRKEKGLPGVIPAKSESQINERIKNRSKYWEVEQMIQKTNDFAILMKANLEFANQLATNSSLPEDSVIVTNENADEVLNDIRNNGISRSYIIVSADFSYNLGHRKYTRFNNSGEAVEVYYRIGSHPSVYSPKIDIISTEYAKAYDIFSKLLEVCSNVFTLKIILDESENYLLLNTKLDCSEVPTSLSDGKDKIHTVIKMTKSPFYIYYNDCDQIKYDSMCRFRELQRALFYVSIIDQIPNKIHEELSNYKELFAVRNGFLDNLLAPRMTEDFKQLKFNILCKQPYTSDLVDRTFPWLTLFYRGLPNDLMNWTPIEKVRVQVDRILTDYKQRHEEICNRYSIPQKINTHHTILTDYPSNMHEKKALDYIMKELVEDFDKPMSEIVEEYETIFVREAKIDEWVREWNKAAEERQYRERDEDYFEARSYRESDDDYYEPRRGRSSSFVGDVAATAIGASIANRGIKKELQKQNAELERQRKEDERRRREEELRRHEEERKERYREAQERKRRQEESLRESIKRNEEQKRRWKEEQERMDRLRRRGR